MTGDALKPFAAVIVGAGASTRFASGHKILAPLNGVPILQYSLDLFSRLGASPIVVVLGEGTLEAGAALVAGMGSETMSVCSGGATRTDSVRNGLAQLPTDVELVAVHDAARPLASDDLVKRVVARAAMIGAAVPAVEVTDTIVTVGEGEVAGALDRSSLRAVQTPQVFRRDWLAACLEDGLVSTDEGTALRRAGYPVGVVEGDPLNVKITWPLDLAIAEVIAANVGGR